MQFSKKKTLLPTVQSCIHDEAGDALGVACAFNPRTRVAVNWKTQLVERAGAARELEDRVSRARGPRVGKGSRANWLRRFGFYCTVALVFLRFSFLAEYIKHLTGKDLYVLYIFGPPALVALLSSGGLRRTFREKGPKIWLGFLVWMCLSVPFSLWRAGSLQALQNYAKTEFVLLLFIVGLTSGWAECRRIMYAIGAATAFMVVVAGYYMRSGAERLSLEWTGSIGNSNDFAAHLLLTLPFLLFVVLKPNTTKLVRLVCVAPLLLGLFEILRTASRGALIALVVTVLFLLLRGSMKQRIAIGATAAVALAAMIAFLPRDTWNRMLSFSSDEASANQGALESSADREQLLEDSIKCTLEHPLLGVGLNQFPNYERAAHGGARWHEPHNSYTQISSECGLPALLLYLAALIWAFRLLARIKRQASGPDKAEIITATYVIGIGVVAYSVAIFFLNFGYAFQFLLVSGLIEAMWRAVRSTSRMRARAALALRCPENLTEAGAAATPGGS